MHCEESNLKVNVKKGSLFRYVNGQSSNCKISGSTFNHQRVLNIC